MHAAERDKSGASSLAFRRTVVFERERLVPTVPTGGSRQPVEIAQTQRELKLGASRELTRLARDFDS